MNAVGLHKAVGRTILTCNNGTSLFWRASWLASRSAVGKPA